MVRVPVGIRRISVLLLAAWMTMSVAQSNQVFPRRTPVAHVLEVQGSVKISDSKRSQRVAQLFATVYDDDRIELDRESLVVLGFRANRQMIRLASPGSFVATKTGVDKPERAEIVDVPAKQRPLVVNVLGELPEVTRAGISLVRGGISPQDQPTSDGITPIHRSTVVSCEPTLSWPAVPEAVAYEVVASYGGGVKAWSAVTKETSLACRPEKPLKDGARCRWQVTAELPGGAFRRAYFGIFSIASAEQRTTATQLAQLTIDAQTPCLALAAMWYFDNGFLAEAIDVAQRLAEKVPEDRAVLQLLHQLYTRAGQRDKAKAVLDRMSTSGASGLPRDVAGFAKTQPIREFAAAEFSRIQLRDCED